MMILRVKEIIEKVFNLRSQETAVVGSVNSQPTEYNLSRIQQLAGGNIHFVIEMLQIYILNADQDFADMKAFSKNSNWKRTGLLAHKLIPGSSYLEINRLVEHLKDIEIRSESIQDDTVLVKLVAQACNEYTEVRPLIIREINRLKSDQSS